MQNIRDTVHSKENHGEVFLAEIFSLHLGFDRFDKIGLMDREMLLLTVLDQREAEFYVGCDALFAEDDSYFLHGFLKCLSTMGNNPSEHQR